MKKVFHRSDIYVTSYTDRTINVEPGDVVAKLQSSHYYIVLNVMHTPENVPPWADSRGRAQIMGYSLTVRRVFTGVRGVGLIKAKHTKTSVQDASWCVKCIPTEEESHQKVRLLLACL